MVDTETMGTRFDAPLLSIGACLFEPETGKIADRFYAGVEMADAFSFGKADGATVRFWLMQSEEARAKLLKGTDRLETALINFREFYKAAGDIPVWSNGATFDLPIIEYAYGRCLREAVPWNYWRARDCRTIEAAAKGLVDRPIRNNDIPHSALDDAIFQAKYISEMWQALLRIAPPPRVKIDLNDL